MKLIAGRGHEYELSFAQTADVPAYGSNDRIKDGSEPLALALVDAIQEKK